MENKRDLLEVYREICLKSSSVSHVGPDFYGEFADLSDVQMEDLIADIAFANADSINRMVFAEPQTHSDKDIVNLIKTNLFLMSRGYLSVNDDGGLGCYAPVGPEPTSFEEEALDRRIQSALPLVAKAIIFGIQRENRDKRPVSLDISKAR